MQDINMQNKRLDPILFPKKVNKKFRFHLLGMAHLPVSEKYMSCAFTQKIVKFSKMMLSLGHEVFIYGAEGSDAPCTQFFETHTLKDIRDTWGEGDNRFDIGYNFKERIGYKYDEFEPYSLPVTKMRENSIKIINAIKKDDDFLLVTMGNYHQPIVDGVKLTLTCEPGVGYGGSIAPFRAFESQHILNYTYGKQTEKKYRDGNFHWRVIPNYFEAEKHPFNPRKEDFFLYVGRLIPHKGLNIAIETTRAIGAKLMIAGQGDLKINADHVETIGYLEPKERADLMGRAKGFFYATIFLEPFGGAAVEAMLAGTPILTTDFGVFPEYNINGVTGYRCNSFRQFVEAAKNVDKLDPYSIRKHAEQFLTDNVKWQYQEWFEEIYKVYEISIGKRKLDWFALD